MPSAERVAKVLQETRGMHQGVVPVLWHFESRRVYWERVDCLREYSEDLREWREVRARAEAEEAARQGARGSVK